MLVAKCITLLHIRNKVMLRDHALWRVGNHYLAMPQSPTSTDRKQARSLQKALVTRRRSVAATMDTRYEGLTTWL